MEESHRKGVAIHPDPESCVVGPRGRHRSVDRGTCRQGIELRNNRNRSADAVQQSGRPHASRRYREPTRDSAQSETPRMHGYSARENRETPSMPASHRRIGPVGEGREPHVQHARRWGVGRSRSTDEGTERGRTTGPRRFRREGDRPRRTPSRRPRPGLRAGPASRARCWVCVKSHARETSGHGSPRCCITSRSCSCGRASMP